MQIHGKLAALLSLVFASTCLWFAIDGFLSPAEVTDPDAVSGGQSFAWFWAFLAAVGAGIAWASWKISGMQAEENESSKP